MVVKVSANVDGFGEWGAVVQGVVQAMDRPDFQRNYTRHLSGQIKRKFNSDAKAMNLASGGKENESGYSLKHVFEWGPTLSSTSVVPLFRLVESGSRHPVLGYEFTPSVVPVPHPTNEDGYGFKSGTPRGLSNHVFQLKAFVMETMTRVKITAMRGNLLFIPNKDSKRGYDMARTTTLNPGGKSTGNFAGFWLWWFETKSVAVEKAQARSLERTIAKTGQKMLRHRAGTVVNGRKVGGQFARQNGIAMVGYVNSKAKEVEREVMLRANAEFDEDKYWGAYGL